MKTPFDLQHSLREWISGVAKNLSEFPSNFDPLVRPADPRFGDFQANGVLPLAKQLRKNPRELATALLEELTRDPRFGPALVQLSIAGPGFINIRLTPCFLTDWCGNFDNEELLSRGLQHYYAGRTVVVDFSSPNTAKQMHVGHIRSTVIGESISRLLEFCGAKVIRDNHIGDWGTQFGILLLAVEELGFDFEESPETALSLLEELYRKGNQLVEEDPQKREQARNELVLLQRGDEHRMMLWERINEISKQAFTALYEQMGISFDLTLGESYYRDKVEKVCESLESAGLAEISEGAFVVFHPEHPRFKDQPFIVRKSDGASNYATTDLATVEYRSEELNADEIVYVTDSRQRDHFEQLFLTVDKWYSSIGRRMPRLTHVWFGTILGEGGKAIKTRSGGSVKLQELLDEGVERARAIVEEKNPDLAVEEKETIAETVGIGAIFYADLMQNRTQDYQFSWDKMLSFEGNTAPYLLYAVARIYAIFRKAGIPPEAMKGEVEQLSTEEEILLARKMVLFPIAISQAIQDFRPHFLCAYLFELANAFSAFYSANRVMTDDPKERERRLMLCARTLLFLETGLELLGIKTLQKM
ncbi:MAG: arginine--tRNA ligase [Verrucomicrobiota bacterium]